MQLTFAEHIIPFSLKDIFKLVAMSNEFSQRMQNKQTYTDSLESKKINKFIKYNKFYTSWFLKNPDKIVNST